MESICYLVCICVRNEVSRIKELWKKIKNKWNDFWLEDEYDNSKKHLSQSDKRFLLYGNFVVGICTVTLVILFSGINNSRISYRNDVDLKAIINIIKSYIGVATEDEYDKIAQTIRHDLVFSDHSEDIEKYIPYISNTSDMCNFCEENFSARIILVSLNTGDAYPLDLMEEEMVTDACRHGVQIAFGYDEISRTKIRILKILQEQKCCVEIERRDGIVSIHKMKSLFCDNCITDILNAIENQVIEELVIIDVEKKIFYPVENERQIKIGDYTLKTEYKDGNYKITVKFHETKKSNCNHNGIFRWGLHICHIVPSLEDRHKKYFLFQLQMPLLYTRFLGQ